MNNYRQLLERGTGLQSNAQSNLPVIPNNGNPGGAYNVASGGSMHKGDLSGATPTLPTRGYAYPWMEPSPSTGRIREMLDKPIQTQAIQNVPTQFNPTGQALPNLGRMPDVAHPGNLPMMPIAGINGQQNVGGVLRNMVASQNGQPLNGIRDPYNPTDMPVIPTFRNN